MWRTFAESIASKLQHLSIFFGDVVVVVEFIINFYSQVSGMFTWENCLSTHLNSRFYIRFLLPLFLKCNRTVLLELKCRPEVAPHATSLLSISFILVVKSFRSVPPNRAAQSSANPCPNIPFELMMPIAGSKAMIQNFAEHTPP